MAPAASTDRQQLNLFVPEGVANTFREQAKLAGYGKQPSPFLAKLLGLHACFLQAVLQRLVQKHTEDPAWFQTPSQRYHARELILFLGNVLEGE